MNPDQHAAQLERIGVVPREVDADRAGKLGVSASQPEMKVGSQHRDLSLRWRRSRRCPTAQGDMPSASKLDADSIISAVKMAEKQVESAGEQLTGWRPTFISLDRPPNGQAEAVPG
jgi:hypothetical protein